MAKTRLPRTESDWRGRGGGLLLPHTRWESCRGVCVTVSLQSSCAVSCQ
ncbi:hypothetical protein E2C01_041675 [Portunus trituberculatus]|uniref:Uncharacterized protein n=1 Tax=Portunus trituberculatus TaxID=210409 RepID=A0A5B7FUC6_PORTR|nr:hypothetical protein [Portunus trituberculatus]